MNSENWSPLGDSGKPVLLYLWEPRVLRVIPGTRSQSELREIGVTRNFGFPETHGDYEVPESEGTPGSGSHPKDSGFEESPIGLRVPLDIRRTPGIWSHTEESGFPDSPTGHLDPDVSWRIPNSRNYTKDSGFPESQRGVRFPGATWKAPGSGVTWRTAGSRRQRLGNNLEDPAFPESQANPGSRTHPEDCFPESSERLRVPGVTGITLGTRSHPENTGFRDRGGIWVSGVIGFLRVYGVTRKTLIP